MPTHLQDVTFRSSALELFQKSVSICVNPCLNLFCLATYGSTLVKNSLQIDLFMQNEPNFRKPQNEPNSIQEKGLRKIYDLRAAKKRTQNEPNSNPISSWPPSASPLCPRAE